VLSDSNYLLPLRWTIKEVQSINETVPSRVFLNEDATEANFKKYAPDYNVLHLAMHTIMKDDNPLHSLLAFTNVEVADTTEDNKLYAYEIYNLKLNAQMAVLSSCSSGFGKMQKGEGMMSLARGFIYAGCPCIVMTLWQVSDKSSSELMTSFYKYLKKGKSKQEAMRLSKMDYLERADDLTSNPFFWSGFVVVGDSSPIYRKSGMFYWVSIIALFIGILIFFQYKKS
jgi:CHAT domain-containing protein